MRNWKLITDGDIFEALVGSLLQADIPGIIVFGRHGPDSGLDAISSDRTHVYQAKFHSDGLMSSAIGSAKCEYKKIKAYREPHHKNFKHWKEVTDWTLVGNFKINPDDEAKWASQIVPLFNSIGIVAHFKGEEQLDVLLDHNPEIERSFFGGGIRTLIYPAEVYFTLSRRSRDDMFFATEMIGREPTLKSVLGFAESPDFRILAVVGAYCSGKTRFLYEAMTAMAGIGWRVFWGLRASMSKSNTWFNSLNSSRKTCVFIDDVRDSSLICEMSEQMSVNERSNWKFIFTCSPEFVRILPPEITTNVQFTTLKLPLLTRKDIANIVLKYPDLDRHSPSVDVVADIAKGMPSLACLMLEFYRKNRQLALPSDSLSLMDMYISRNLEALDLVLRDKARIVLRWAALWDGISIRGEDTRNTQLDFLQNMGVKYDETRLILKGLSDTGLVDSWRSYGCDCYRVSPAFVARHIIGTWILEKDSDAYRVGPDGGKLIELLLKANVPHEEKIFKTIPVVLGSYLNTEDEAERLLRPVLDHLREMESDADIVMQHEIIGMVAKIGRFVPESALGLLRNIFSNPQPDCQYINHWGIVHAIAETLAGISEYVRNRFLAIQFVQLFKDIYESIPDENRCSNNKRDEIAKNVSSVINHFGELRYFPDVALSMVLEQLKAGDMGNHPFEQMLARQVLEAERQSFESYSYRTVTFCRRAIRFGSNEWKRAIIVRDELKSAIRRQTNSREREVLWKLFRYGYQFVHNFGCVFADQGDQPTADAKRMLVNDDLIFLKSVLEDTDHILSIRQLLLMREVWEWEYTYGGESEYKMIANECERLFVIRLGFPFQHLICLHSKEHAQCINDVAERFLKADSADEIDSFLDKAANYYRADNGGTIKGMSGLAFSEIAERCARSFDFDSTNPISIFTMRCLQRFDDEHPLSVAFATTQIANYIKRQKSCLDHGAFESLFLRILSAVKDGDCFLKNVYWSGEAAFFGSFTNVELECLLASNMAPSDFARVLPPWIRIDCLRVLNRLSLALDNAREIGQNSDAVLEGIIDSFYLAIKFRNELDERHFPLGWIVEKFNEGYAGSKILTNYSFVELSKLKRTKLGMKELLCFVEAWISRERSRNYDNLYHDEFCPQELFVIDDIVGFNKVCDLIFVDDSIFVSKNLGRIISAIDFDGNNTFNYIFQYLSLHPYNSRDELACLARLIAYRQNSDVVKEMMKMICDRCSMLMSQERSNIYYNMLPNEHGVSRKGNEVPKEYIDAHKAAQDLYDNEPDDSSVKEFYQYCIDRTVGTINMIRNHIEEEKHI
ncbi:MAG: hypothetical protein IJU44_02955 [Kiritimatiellae bacterium]|nr:hypothetical protein [Kiritimatiellia bacterium]